MRVLQYLICVCVCEVCADSCFKHISVLFCPAFLENVFDMASFENSELFLYTEQKSFNHHLQTRLPGRCVQTQTCLELRFFILYNSADKGSKASFI